MTPKEKERARGGTMKTPNGDLEVLREFTCGCIVYRDASKREFSEQGLFCNAGGLFEKHGGRGDFVEIHKRALVQGEETQTSLF